MTMQKWEQDIRAAKESYWENPDRQPFEAVRGRQRLGEQEIKEASMRLERFAPLIMRLFPETKAYHGLIESPLLCINATKDAFGADMPRGDLYLKCDSHLAIAGSVKARGGIYEVLKHTEELALQAGLLNIGEDYAKLADHRDFFAGYKVQVGSTGNLGMSIGIMSAALGYHAIVHMSKDAKAWKKELLRSKGVEVREYESDYCKAVQEGRKMSDADSSSYFVDDEHSENLFLGYAVAGERLRKQLEEQHIPVDEEHPLFVYIPCGVGGAPGGITFGLKQIFGNHVHCFFVEPTQAPCMYVALASGKGSCVAVEDFGLSGRTQADGLAVQRASSLVVELMKPLVSGLFTVADERLYDYMRTLYNHDHKIIEPSSCAAFAGYTGMVHMSDAKEYLRRYTDHGQCPTHVIWATGGSMMPEYVVEEYLNTGIGTENRTENRK